MSSYAIAALLLTAPFFAYRFAARGGNATAFRAALIFAVGALLLDHFRRTREGETSDARPAAPMLVPLWLFLFYCLFQTTRSQYDIALPILLVTIEGVITVTVLVLYIRTAGQLASATGIYALGAAIPVLIGCYQVYGVASTGGIPPLPLTGVLAPWLVPYDPELFGGIHLTLIEGLVFPRVASTLVDANFFGIYITGALLCVMGRTVGLLSSAQRRPAQIAVHGTAVAAGLVVLLFTMSRSAWLGFAAGAAYLVFHSTRSHRESWRVRLATVVIGVLAVGLFWQILVLTGLDVPILALSRAQDLSGGFSIRYDLASEAMDAFAENPLFGVGRANLIPFTGYTTAHNFYITRLAEDGLIGFGVVAAWLAIIWFRGTALVSRDVDPVARWAATGLRSAFLALLVANIPYDHFMSTEVNWVLVGLAAATGRVVPPLLAAESPAQPGGAETKP